MLKNLKNLRKEFGVSQKEIADKLNISQQTYSDYENDKTEPTMDLLIKIADYFKISIDELLGRVDFNESSNISYTSPDLSEKEKSLLEAFRQLLPETQDFILRTAQSLKDKRDKLGAK